MNDTRYRNELKYLITDNEAEIIRQELSSFLKTDEHASGGKYLISSLYFDDLYENSFYDVDDGIDQKEKYRIRIYDHSTGMIKLECKRKKNTMTSKTSCDLDIDTARLLMEGKYPKEIAKQSNVLQWMTYGVMCRRLRPVIIVEYERIPFVYKYGNVRITLDKNICSSSDLRSFFGDYTLKRPILPEGKHLLEVKYDEYMPDHIYNCLNDLDLQRISFSKYYLCRAYNVKGGLLL